MFQKLKKHIVIVLLCVLCIGMLPTANVQASQNFKNEVKNSVVVVAIAFEDTNGSVTLLSHGTGWFVGEKGKNPEYLITNDHVVSTYVEFGSGGLVDLYIDEVTTISGRAKVLIYYSSSNYEEAYIVHTDATKDLALLRINEPTTLKQPLQLAEVSEDMAGSTIYVVGFPGISDNIYNSAISKWSEEDASIYSGVISRFLTVQGTGIRLVQTDADIQHGNSGGPMVNEKGYVVGINASGVNGAEQGEMVRYAISVEELIPILNQYDVAYQMGGSVNMSNIVFIVAGVVAIAAICGVVVVILKKKKQKRVIPASDVTQTKKAIIRSLAAQHNGMTVPLTAGQEICIGRNFSICRVVFQDNTPGVSSRHCSLVWNESANNFTLIDLQSTYGTYLANGQCLTPGVPFYLRSGECFYVGDPANMLRVEVE